MRKAQEVTKNMESVDDDNLKMKVQNLLNKKVKELEVLSNSVLFKEKELLSKYKDKLEDSDLEENKAKYEKRGLLENSSDEDEDEEIFAKKTGKRVRFADEEEFEFESHEDFVKQRTEKINGVANSL
mmetsp:Transcript_6807/g.5062  ORF Transcript_6807/g.5062 Transcript_6807/m.5062 type:complete len:127 (+) Transcript_6807:221-601(+)